MPKRLKPHYSPHHTDKPKTIMKSISVGMENNVASPLRKMSTVGKKMVSVLRRGSLSSQSSCTDSKSEEARHDLDPDLDDNDR